MVEAKDKQTPVGQQEALLTSGGEKDKTSIMTLDKSVAASPEQVSVDCENPTAADRVRRLVEVARDNLEPLLRDLAGRVFEPDEADEAREVVSLINHMAGISKTPLVYGDQEVSLKYTIQKSNGRPVFHLRKLGGSAQETMYAKKVFPLVSAKKIPDRDKNSI